MAKKRECADGAAYSKLEYSIPPIPESMQRKYPEILSIQACSGVGTKRVKRWRWGRDGEPAIVTFYAWLCPSCYARDREGQAEAEWEARVS